MKSLTKHAIGLIVSLVMIVSLFVGSGLFSVSIAFAADKKDNAYKYFYGQLIDGSMEQRFYNAFETLLSKGEFEKGSFQYDLVAGNVVTEAEAASYINGSTYMAEAYGAGRDAFYMDHPDLFYADVFSTSISAGQNGSGKSVAYLDTSRALNTYRGNLNSEQAVNTAIDKYETQLSAIVTEANKSASVKGKVEYVNNYLKTNVKYGFGTKVEGDRNVDTEKAAFIFTSYGALVNKESVCEGYAKAFKAVMDRLEIPCICVQGYADGSGEGDYEPHMWNYVNVEGQWYIVDPTYNASSNKQWLLSGGESMHNTHIEDGVVSSSGYELEYPALKPYEYGNDTDGNGLSITGVYKGEGNTRQLDIYVSYNDKGAAKLEKENKYLALREGNADDKGGITWGSWRNSLAWSNSVFEAGYSGDLPYIDSDNEIIIRMVGSEYIQFALIDHGPDKSEKLSVFDTKEYLFAYDPENLGNIEPSAPYRNDTVIHDSQNPAPGGIGNPLNTGAFPYDKTYKISLTYTDDLELVDANLDPGIKFNVSVSDDVAQKEAQISDFHWDGGKVVSFTFKPSRMYVHSMATYYFTPTNLVGKKSHKIPNPVMYQFSGKSVVCSKVFNDGRLYMNVFGTPKLLDDSDLSVSDFKDENGKYYAESQRSQLMLVATKTDETAQMNGLLKDEMNVQSGDVVSSSTYEINLQICGIVTKVPNGSYMQVAFGFPEGYDKDDAGTTFKIYHYKHDDKGNITGVEEIPVIVTEYGLIAQVTSFSPFTIVQIKNTSAAVTNGNAKNIYASVNGNSGGTVTADGKTGIITVDGDSVTYDIKADEGYAIGSVMLNGKLVKAADYKNGKLTISKSDLSSSNMLEVSFVSKESAAFYKEQGVNLAFGGTISEPADDISDGPNVAGIVIGVLVGLLVLGGGGFAIWWFLIRNKKEPAKAAAGAKTAKSGQAAANKTSSAKGNGKSSAAKKPAKPAAKSAKPVNKKK